jgi:hypothetical protein
MQNISVCVELDESMWCPAANVVLARSHMNVGIYLLAHWHWKNHWTYSGAILGGCFSCRSLASFRSKLPDGFDPSNYSVAQSQAPLGVLEKYIHVEFNSYRVKTDTRKGRYA